MYRIVSKIKSNIWKHLFANVWEFRVSMNASGASKPPPSEKSSHIQQPVLLRRSFLSSQCHRTLHRAVTRKLWAGLVISARCFLSTRTVGEMRGLGGGGDEQSRQQQKQTPERRIWVCFYQRKVSAGEKRRNSFLNSRLSLALSCGGTGAFKSRSQHQYKSFGMSHNPAHGAQGCWTSCWGVCTHRTVRPRCWRKFLRACVRDLSCISQSTVCFVWSGCSWNSHSFRDQNTSSWPVALLMVSVFQSTLCVNSWCFSLAMSPCTTLGMNGFIVCCWMS